MGERLVYEHVDISYNGSLAVHDISFVLEPGEILGIVGESGSGKSTLIKAAMGLLGPGGMVTRGDIWYAGANLAEMDLKERLRFNGSELAMIFQIAGSSFCPIRTVREQLIESMSEHGKITDAEFNAKADGLFRKIGFDDPERVLSSYPFELSGGMQQRVGIASAMMLDPKILLADEPTSALDVSVQKQVVLELLKVRELFGTSIMIVTHNIGVVGAMADRVMVMKDGEMVEYGDTKQVIEDPQEEYTKKLMAAVPRLRR